MKMSLKDRLQTESAVRRVDWRLGARVTGARRRAIRRELREHLRDAAEVEGTDEAVRQLGDLRAVADAYLESEERLLRIAPGLWAAGAVLSLLVLLALGFSLVYTAGVEAGLAEGASGSYAVEVADGFGPFAGAYSVADPRWMQVSMLTPFHLVAAALAFLVGARTWRLVTRRS